MNFEDWREDVLRRIARQNGVPDFWLEDAAQEMRLKIWKAEVRGWKAKPITQAISAAIDFSRKYGAYIPARRTHTVDRYREPVLIPLQFLWEVSDDALS